MSRARHTSLALALGVALSLIVTSSAWAVTVNVSNTVVNPNQAITATADLSDLTPAELLLVTAVEFRFTGDDADLRTDSAAPYTADFTYATAGTKTLTMTVRFSAGDPEFDDQDIRVNAAPTARFTRSVSIPNPGQSVRFDGGASTDDAALPEDAYDWDFDNNGTFEVNNQRVVQRSFATAGNKVIRMRATDPQGRASTFATTMHVNFAPAAALTFNPATPLVGQAIDLTSVSEDSDGWLVSEQWDLDGDGQYDDANGPVIRGTYRTAGLHTVRLRVMDNLGRVDTEAVTFNVRAPDVPAPKLLNPWPKIRIVGFAGSKRVRLDMLTVKVLRGATVKVRCAGKGCPRRKAVSTRSGKKALVRLRWLERRLRPGTHIYMAITYPGTIGRYERILLRKRKEPLRRMQCLYPGEPAPRACP